MAHVQGKKRLSPKLRRLLYGLAGVLVLVAAWWIVSAILESQRNYALPSPYEVLLALGAMLFGEGAGLTYSAIGYTLARSLVGFALAFLVGGLLGILAHGYEAVEAVLAPWNKLTKIFPTAAVSLILVVLLSRDATMMNLIPAFLSFLISEPIVYEGFRNGLRNGPSKDEIEALSLDGGARSWAGLFGVELPAAEGYILTAVASSLGLGIKVTIMSEVLANFSNVNRGLGSLIVTAQQYAMMDELIAYSLLAIVVSAVFDLAAYLIKKAARLIEERKELQEAEDRRLE